MAEVITQADIMKYDCAERAVFEEGTVITPAARDWAKEHGVCIVIGNEHADKAGMSIPVLGSEKVELLEKVIKISVMEIKKQGLHVHKNILVDTVINCLEKLGCKIEK